MRKTWWKESVVYQVYPRSFADSNNDGIGDFEGLIEKLDYLNDGNPATHTDLGITGIWLMPISPSPSYHGYDVTDYYGINPQYGTRADFERFLAECHKRGIKLIAYYSVAFDNYASGIQPEWLQTGKDGQFREAGDELFVQRAESDSQPLSGADAVHARRVAPVGEPGGRHANLTNDSNAQE